MEFTYDAYRGLLAVAKKKFEIRSLGDADEPVGRKPILLMRHDVDISIEKALVLACIEAAEGIESTYMLMLGCPLYGVEIRAFKDDLAVRLSWLTGFGRDIGFHIEVDDLADAENAMEIPVHDLEKLMDVDVGSVSFHAPSNALLHKYLWEKRILNRINAYAGIYTGLYITDSGGRWRAGSLSQFLNGKCRMDADPLKELRRTKETKVQLLTHPIWWGDAHLEPLVRLESVKRWLVGEGMPEKDVDAGFELMVPRLWRSRLLSV